LPSRWIVLALISLLVAANTFSIAADIAAMGEALSLVIGGLDHEHALIFASTSQLLTISRSIVMGDRTDAEAIIWQL
jgi:hypothetical protein